MVTVTIVSPSPLKLYDKCAKIVEYLHRTPVCELLPTLGSVAQLVEQWPFKPFVAGSNPAGPTKCVLLEYRIAFDFITA